MQRKESSTSKPSRIGRRPKPSGEGLLFLKLYTEQNMKCLVSGKKLLPPEHPMFHCQGSHCLPKGTYPEWKLREENVVMILKQYHDQWNIVKEKTEQELTSLGLPETIPLVMYFQALREHVYDPSKPMPEKPAIHKQ